ncbi:hypothetical protein EZ437_01765 [Pedobacter psychroterrae]|uniref:Capsule assembly protein Wzi n=2 Tax=Pedobacter psychroterrae TaxID=2530453 RepID=A0A4R0NP49_9SPHI|nr:hypothetical protein EZ437_01765 [Pedobacter psychroterrae]
MKINFYKIMKLRLLFLLSLLLISVQLVNAQTLPVGLLDNTDDLYRRQQLLGKDSSKISFMVRPVHLSGLNNLLVPGDVDGKTFNDWNKVLWQNPKGNIEVRALPVVWQQQINSHHPYGWNDGAIISAKGYQTSLSAGVFAKIGRLKIQLRPEFVYAANPYFLQTYEADNETAFKSAIANYYNRIDAPERIGNDSYSKANLGQSSIKLDLGSVAIGVSNESLWWGPGVRNSLLMSNNAPGFLHATVNTIRPIQTPIGSFESQIIGGRLEGSGILPPSGLKYSKFDDWRYISGIVFVYQPKWVSGLYLGFDRTFTTYRSEMGTGLGDYFPLFSGLEKKGFQNDETLENSEDGYRRDQIFSLFARWLMPESNSEIYFQFGREDHAWDFRDAFAEPEYSRAYVAGFRKLIPFKSRLEEFVQVGIELTQLEPAGSKASRPTGIWYSHSQLNHGYTNKGQFIGAGIGPDNLQSVDVAWVKGLKRIGFLAERRVHNNGLYYRAVAGQIEPRRHWVDLGLGGNLDWDYKHFVLNARMIYTHSFNYQYRVENQDPNLFWVSDKQDADNLHLKLGLMYRW